MAREDILRIDACNALKVVNTLEYRSHVHKNVDMEEWKAYRELYQEAIEELALLTGQTIKQIDKEIKSQFN